MYYNGSGNEAVVHIQNNATAFLVLHVVSCNFLYIRKYLSTDGISLSFVILHDYLHGVTVFR